MKKLFVRVLALSVALSIAVAGGLQAEPRAAVSASQRLEQIRKIHRYRTTTWRWQALMARPRTPTRFTERRTRDAAYLRWVRALWQRRAAGAERQATNPPHKRAWLCIQRYERHPAQGWATRTGNGYYGGLQMDLAFQRSYGRDLLRRKGTADNWSAREQMWVAERALRSGRGFYPWPRTARACGLI